MNVSVFRSAACSDTEAADGALYFGLLQQTANQSGCVCAQSTANQC